MKTMSVVGSLPSMDPRFIENSLRVAPRLISLGYQLMNSLQHSAITEDIIVSQLPRMDPDILLHPYMHETVNLPANLFDKIFANILHFVLCL